MAIRLPPLPRSEAANLKVSQKLTGRARSAETRAKIAETMRGRKLDPERIRRAVEGRKRSRAGRSWRKSDSEILVESRARNLATPKWIIARQLKRDLLKARLLQRYDLVEDLRLSRGSLQWRTLFDPTGRVSHGWFGGTIRWGAQWIPYDGVLIDL